MNRPRSLSSCALRRCLAPGAWPTVRRVAVGLTRRQGIRRVALGHVYGGAAVPVSCGCGVVRLRATHTGLQSGHRFWLLFGGGAEFELVIMV